MGKLKGMADELVDAIQRLIREKEGKSLSLRKVGSSHGGCIHDSGVWSDGNDRYFVKCNSVEALEQFEAEADGLTAVQSTGAIRVPNVVGVGVGGGQAFLVMEALELSNRAPAGGWAEMGKKLAKMHRCLGENFGWQRNNFIGSTTQSNARHESWAEFFVRERLRPQFELAVVNGFAFDGVDKFLVRVGELLQNHQPQPSLLHGDLWSGNAAFTTSGDPVIYDPAVYYGDQECDLAFSEFFGGFPSEFYRGYQEEWLVDKGFDQRKGLYNLYHVLNHANLFGGGYTGQARFMMSEIGR